MGTLLEKQITSMNDELTDIPGELRSLVITEQIPEEEIKIPQSAVLENTFLIITYCIFCSFCRFVRGLCRRTSELDFTQPAMS